MNKNITIDWKKNYDPDVHLWWADGPGHTRDTQTLKRRHVVPAGGGALVIAAQLGQLDQLSPRAILQTIRSRQNLETGHPRFGNVCFHYEDGSIQDGNAGFFLGQSLAILGLEFFNDFDEESRALLLEISRDLAVCMNRDARSSSIYYPNKHLGDIVVAHLLSQFTNHAAQLHELDALLIFVAREYLANGWGWGEDLSDIYSKILIDEVSLMLCLARNISEEARAACLDLLRHLVVLEDQFGGGPRVPAIRSYSFLESPIGQRRNYRDAVAPWTQETAPKISHVPQAGPLLHARGWHALVPPRAEREKNFSTRLFGGRSAMSRVESDFRIGAVSRFPLMDSAEHPDWGLAWQSMPVGFFHEKGDWSFIQWFSQCEGNPAGHPAVVSHKTDPTRVFRALSPKVSPPIVGKTFSIMRGGGVIAFRWLPAVQTDWEHVGDRLRIVAPTAAISLQLENADWPRLTLAYPARTVGVSLIDPWRRSMPALHQTDSLADWSISLSQAQLAHRRGIALIWAIHPDGFPEHAPVITPARSALKVPRSPDELAFDIEWTWPTHQWRITIDPLSATPLVEA